MASIIRNIVHGIEYGNVGKKRWTQCGILIEKDGKFYVKLTHIPLSANDTEGMFFSVFEQNSKPASPPRGQEEDFSDDIPF